MSDNSEYGLLTMMGGKLDKDLRGIEERLTLIEEKLDLLLSRTPTPPASLFDYVVKVAAPPAFSSAVITGASPKPPEDDD